MTDRAAGTLHVIGVGPGNPELMTLKAARLIAAAPVVAFFAKRGCPSHARTIASGHMRGDAEELRFEYPFTTELDAADACYRAEMTRFYDAVAGRIAGILEQRRDLALLCEGDPFLYGSAIHVFDRLCADYRCDVVPGISAMSACWSGARLPIVCGGSALSVIPATLDAARLGDRLDCPDAAVVMKVGRNLGKLRAALHDAGRADRAVYVEYGSTPEQRVLPLAAAPEAAPYFSLVLVPARQ